MNTRGVIGKRIVAVRQQRMTNTAGDSFMHVYALVLEDGTELRPDVRETESPEYGVIVDVVKPSKERTK